MVNNPPVFIVTWEDSAYYGTETYTRQEAEEKQFVRIHSTGFLVRDDAEQVIIAGEWQENDDTFRFLHVIPRSAVKRIQSRGTAKRMRRPR